MINNYIQKKLVEIKDDLELFDDDNPNIPFIEFIESLDFEDLHLNQDIHIK